MNEQNLDQLSGWQRLTINARNVIVRAHELAGRYRNPQVSPIHVFLALVDDPSSLVSRIFDQAGIDLDRTRVVLTSEVERRAKSEPNSPKFSTELKELINKSFLMSERLSHVYVGTEHLLMAILEMGGEDFMNELRQLGLTSDRVAGIVTSLGTYPPGILSQSRQMGVAEELEQGSSLPFFSRNMNEMAERGQFLKITGRDEEIGRLIHILSRKTKNNPILVGDAGVGKTAVVEGLAQRIVAGDVPPSFLNKTILSLDVAAIVAGARVRGDVEERILNLVNDAIEDGDKVIFIDEIHMIIGGGSSGGRDPMDIGNILKPYLTDPNLRIIGATTNDEYRRYFDDEPALSRRFQPIFIDEISKESALDILRNIKKDFEEFHGVRIKEEALKEAVELSDKFIADRYLPDKAIDLLDEAAASVKIGREIQNEPRMTELGDKLAHALERKSAAIADGNMRQASKYKVQEEELTEQIRQLESGKHHGSGRSRTVDDALIRKIVVDWTKIPLAAASLGDDKLKNLEGRISKRVISQDQVVKSVVEAIKRSHLGLTSSKRPLASFLFLGPTGVGKTELAKTIAAEVFGSSDLLVQLNMSEYMEMHSVAKMIGSPPGYVGYTEGGQLTEEVRRRPYSVVLFDEIEKAHPEVLNLLLQILDEGELKDGRGRKAVFRNTIVILTSNIGAEEVSRDNKLGFNVEISELQSEVLDKAYEEMRDSLLDSLKLQVRPELLNRLDGISVFRGLNQNDSLKIAEKQLKELSVQLFEKGIMLDIAPGVAKVMNKLGYSSEYGARNVRRKIQELVENGLANFVMEQGIKRPKKGMLEISVKVRGDELVFSID